MKLLIAGGTGYVGGRLREWLAEQGRHEVRVGSRDPGGHVGMVALDWNSDASLEAACRGIDGVIHVSGMNAASAAADPAGALAAYGEGAARLARAAAAHGVGRLLYVSSAHVYGDALAGVVDENTEPRPSHPYGLGHAAAERSLRAAPEGLRCVIVRLANSFGAPVGPATGCWKLLANDLARQAVRSRRLVLRTAGGQRRDFIALREACRVFAHLLESSDAQVGAGVFNAGGGTRSVLEIARHVQARVAALLGFTPELVVGTDDDSVGGKLREYSIARLRATGFEPEAGAFESELDRLIAWCSAHESAAA